MVFYWLTLGVLATWRITHLLQAEDGPWAIVARLRRALGDGFWGHLLDCFHCLSIWVALALAVVIGQAARERLLLWPALSAGAILLQRLSTPHPTPAPYFEELEEPYFEEKENDDALLRRREERGGPTDPVEPPGR